jgi:hypothetical protein
MVVASSDNAALQKFPDIWTERDGEFNEHGYQAPS